MSDILENEQTESKFGRKRKLSGENVEDFKKLCELHCTLDEIAGFFDVSRDTIERWCKRQFKETFAECYKKFSASGKISLRRVMWQKALQGNTKMMIWLSKNELGYRDHLDIKGDAGNYQFFLSYKLKDEKENNGGAE